MEEKSCTVAQDDNGQRHDDVKSQGDVPMSDIAMEEVPEAPESETSAWSKERTLAASYVDMTKDKGRCLFTSKSAVAGGIIFIEAPTLVAIPSVAPEIWKQLQKLHEEKPLELGAITFYFAAIASILTLERSDIDIMLDKFVPDPSIYSGTFFNNLGRNIDEAVTEDIYRILKSVDFGKKASLMTGSLLQRLLSAWRYNSFGHHTEDGLVMYNRISMCAHSCDPSCCWSFGDDDAFVLRARRAMPPGGELTISYLQDDDLLKSIKVRRQKLINWKFNCACERCVEVIDYARGFRCGRCRTGSCYFKETSGKRQEFTQCKMCDFSYSQEEVLSLLETEESYANRVDTLNKTDIPDVELVYMHALDPFAEHWVLYVMDTILFESYRDKKNCLEAAEHQQRRIRYHTNVFPRVTFILAWAHEELADIMQSTVEKNNIKERQGYMANWIARYRQATYMLSILCGPTHVYTQGPHTKWQNLQAQVMREIQN